MTTTLQTLALDASCEEALLMMQTHGAHGVRHCRFAMAIRLWDFFRLAT